MKSQPTKKAQSKPKPKAKPKPKPKPVEPKWDKPEKLPRTYLEGTEPKTNEPKTRVGMSNQQLMDAVKKIHESEENLTKKKKAEKIATFSVTLLAVVLLGWMWTYSELRNQSDNYKKLEQNYQFQVDSLTEVVSEMQVALQLNLDTIHNNSSKIPE